MSATGQAATVGGDVGDTLHELKAGVRVATEQFY